ncbi:MAG TPA: SRPBCC family protein [Gemmatimonadales bacterium]|nr:SRPBCC family protein [Gemmatimonadales bacterium]
MIVEAQTTINGSKEAVWAAITNIEQLAETISGIERIEILERPTSGLVGLGWRETRMLRGRAATVEKRITEAADNQFYKTIAASDGFEFLTTRRISGSSGAMILSETHEFNPRGGVARVLSVLMGIVFKGVIRKAIIQDLYDIKVAVEQP